MKREKSVELFLLGRMGDGAFSNKKKEAICEIHLLLKKKEK